MEEDIKKLIWPQRDEEGQPFSGEDYRKGKWFFKICRKCGLPFDPRVEDSKCPHSQAETMRREEASKWLQRYRWSEPRRRKKDHGYATWG